MGKWYLEFFSSVDFEHNVAVATCLTVMSLPLFLYGFQFGERGATSPVPPRFEVGFKSTGLGFWLAYFVLGFGFLGMLSFARSIGGIGAVLDQMENIFSRNAWREVSSNSYYIGMLLMTGPPILLLLATQEKKGRFSIIAAGITMIFAAGILVATQASREKAIFPLILFIITFFVLSRGEALGRRKKASLGLVVFAGVALLLTFSVQTFFRSGGGETDGQLIKALSDFNRIDVSMVMFVDYFNHSSGNDFLFGKPLLAYPSRIFVKLFDSEPILNTSEILQRYIFAGNQNSGNPGSPLAGELYLSFGFFGYAAFPVFGYFFGRMHARLHQSGFSFWRSAFYSVFLYLFMFKLCIYTGASESVLMIALTVLPLFFWKRLLQVRPRFSQ